MATLVMKYGLVIDCTLMGTSDCILTGLSHGPGFVPGANVGAEGAIFEQGTRHVGMDIAGKDVANPTGTRCHR